jgi:hypothetical protein
MAPIAQWTTAGLDVVQAWAQLGQQMHPLLQIEPLLASQGALIGCGQVRDLCESAV